MVFYFVTKQLVPGSLLQRFVDGDDEFRTSRLKLIPGCPKVRQGLSNLWCNAVVLKNLLFPNFTSMVECPYSMKIYAIIFLA